MSTSRKVRVPRGKERPTKHVGTLSREEYAEVERLAEAVFIRVIGGYDGDACEKEIWSASEMFVRRMVERRAAQEVIWSEQAERKAEAPKKRRDERDPWIGVEIQGAEYAWILASDMWSLPHGYEMIRLKAFQKENPYAGGCILRALQSGERTGGRCAAW